MGIQNAEFSIGSMRDLKRSPSKFFVLVYALSVPLWVLEVLFPMHLPIQNLPVLEVLATFVPMIAASILVYRGGEPGGARRFLSRAFDYRRITKKTWFVPAIFLMPVIFVLTYFVMRLIGLPVSTEFYVPLTTPLLFLAFFFAAAGEEIGYTGYVTDPMQAQYTALTASLIIGVIHSAWHYPSGIQVGQTLELIAWGTVLGISFRILSVWLYNNGGKSVFLVILFHAVTNTARSLFPGPNFLTDLADVSVGYSLVAIVVAVVVFLWGSRTLALFRYARKEEYNNSLERRRF